MTGQLIPVQNERNATSISCFSNGEKMNTFQKLYVIKVYLWQLSETIKPSTFNSMIKICLTAKENINVDTAPTTVISIHFNTQYNAIANKTNMLFSLAEPGI